MQPTGYRDPIIQKVIDLFEATGPSVLQAHYINGDVLKPDKSALPVCYVAKDTTTARPADNMEDEHTMPLVATIVYDYTQDLNEAYNIVAGTNDLYEMMEGRYTDADVATNPSLLKYALKQDSLLYIARNSQQIDTRLWIGVGTDPVVNYGLGFQRRGPGIFSVEATLRFTVRLHTPRPGLPLNI